jgi:glycosyltransferase involved in cell wall biosynthesis
VKPELSFIMPCYNEQATVPHSIPQLLKAFELGGHRIEIVACDNGSSDRTLAIIQKFAADGLPVVAPSRGEERGVRQRHPRVIPVCSAPWIGIIAADAQVDAEDAVRLFDVIKFSDGLTLGKVRRRFRMDGFRRKIVSIVYNGLMFLLWPRLGSIRRQRQPQDRSSRRPGGDAPGVQGLVHRSGNDDQGALSRGARAGNERLRPDAVERPESRAAGRDDGILHQPDAIPVRRPR